MAKEKFVTRRVLESKTYNVYEMKGTTLTLLDTINAKGKVSETDLATKYKVEKVILDCIKENKAIYGVPVDEFMKIAVLMPEKEEPNDIEEANNAETNDTEEANNTEKANNAENK